MGDATHGDKKRRLILDTTLKIWADDPSNITVRAIADQCGLNHSTVLYHFQTVEFLKNEAAALAVVTGYSRVIAQLIATKNPAIKHMNDQDRREHMIAAGL